eukprot:TRINITY_DN20316_c0_g1_i1.p1 TRINITY_DN20316_c0_g1~~TRINITY_DN20316_c0_g1_i1.p1  ORF type:complete len:186 (+),score=40.66 TRINITY_DN20316_c0_g1_i1:324-881(+)
MAQAAFDGHVLQRTKHGLSVATFAGGCFWGPQLLFDRLHGVEASAVGYTHGHVQQPTYQHICSGSSGHTEGVQVFFDESQIAFDDLLTAFWAQIDPLQEGGQGNDRGSQYRSGIYPHTEEHLNIALASREALQTKYTRPIATEVKAAVVFWPAEPEHQKYLEKGGRFSSPQSAEKGSTEPIRCYG